MKKKKKALYIVLSIVAVIGLGLLLINPIKGLIRQSYSDKAINIAEKAIVDKSPEPVIVKVPITDALSIDGEDGNLDNGIDKLLQDMRDLSAEYEYLTLLGILEIPCIDVKEPIWDTCSTNALRYGVGRYPGTAELGTPGLCNLFGHRQNGNLDAKLGSLQLLQGHIGEEVIVTTTDGVQHIYTIVDTVHVTDSELMPYLRKDTYEEETLCITACGWGRDPYSGTYYPTNTEFIAICQLKSHEALV